MKTHRLAAWCALVAMLANASITCGQTMFRTELQKKYNFRSVSCFTCHEKNVPSDVDEPKKYRNAFGKMFDKEFAGKNISQRLNEVKSLDRDDPKRVKVEEEIKKEFHAALEKIEQMEVKGRKIADWLKSGDIEGVKLR